MQLPRLTSRLGIASGCVGGTLALAFVTGVGPAPALSSAFQDGSSSSTSSTSSTSTTATTPTTVGAPAQGAGSRTIDAAGAGTVSVSASGGSLNLASAVPTAGWRVEVEQAAGREIEVDFRRGTQRVQVNVEFEDGAVSERVRFRDDATGTDIRTENGVVVRAEGPGVTADRGGATGTSGSGTSGSGTSGRTDDSGHDVGDDHGGDSGSSGSGSGGSDDSGHDVGDDHGGDSGSGGSGRGGADDPPGDDHGGDD
jgi:hypothetical protein